MVLNRISRRKTGAILLVLGMLLAAALAVLLAGGRELSVRMLYATSGDQFDAAAYGHLAQAGIAGLKLERKPLEDVSAQQLGRYDTVYLDPSLQGALTPELRQRLEAFVAQGGHLFLENGFANDFEPEFLGAQSVVPVSPPETLTVPAGGLPPGLSRVSELAFVYPEAGLHLQGLQELFAQFMDNYMKHDLDGSLRSFEWGKGIVPSTAQTIVGLRGASQPVALYALNRYGEGAVFFSGMLLPNRYHITGYDLMSGMDPQLGFERLAAEINEKRKPEQGSVYFNRNKLPVEPYFNFTFAAGSAMFRSEYAAFVSKEKLGYSVSKVLGPYGRPAMAYQNHFEALEAIRDKEGIQWAELLREYDQIPSFSLVRATYRWGRWTESAVVHLNEGTNEKPSFQGETPNSFYSSGIRIMAEDGPVQGADYGQSLSLGDPVQLPYRAYPALADLDGDGKPELIVGSADGFIYAYRNLGASAAAYGDQQLPANAAPPDAFGKREPLRLASGEPLAAGSYASVAAYDLNGDGRPDLLLGREDGTLAVAYGQAGGTFAAPVPLTAGGQPIRGAAPLAPTVGDVTGDGIPDLVVGDASGGVTLYRGVRPAAEAGSGAAAWEAGRLLFRLPVPYAAPSVRDMNGDGRADLVVGNLEGDLRIYVQTESGGWEEAGVIEGASLNQVGNHALVGGHNSVPLWYDLNHDGKDDLIVGQLEFGLPTPLDSPHFAYADELNEFIQYAKEHHLELYPHLFFHNYRSDEQEKQEIALHRAAFDKLGIPWGMTGTNQHTWRVSHGDRMQTLNNERDAGIWFNFGFRPPYDPNEPRLGLEYNWGLPFLLTDSTGEPQLDKPMVLHTPAPVLRTDPIYSTKDIFTAYARLDMPIDYFEHIEYHFPSRVGELLNFVRYMDEIRDTYSYNFMTEPQMARSFLNTLTTDVKLYRPWRAVVSERLRKAFGLAVEPSFVVKPDTSRVPAQAAEYKGTLGLVVEPGIPYAARQPVADGSVYDLRGGKLYFGAPASINVRFAAPSEGGNPAGGQAAADKPHLTRINVPYRLDRKTDVWKLELQSAGMQQLQVYSRRTVTAEGSEWKTEYDEEEHLYTFTRYGDAASLTLRFGP